MLPISWKAFDKIATLHTTSLKSGHPDKKDTCPFKRFSVKIKKCNDPLRNIGVGRDTATITLTGFKWNLFNNNTLNPEMNRLINSIVKLNKSTSLGIVKDVLDADKVYDSDAGFDFDKALSHLIKHVDLEIVEVLWRLSRLYHKKCENMQDLVVKRSMLQDAVGYADRALAIDIRSAESHLWKALCLHELSKMEGLREYYTKIWTVKEHLEKSKMLKPDEPLVYHLNGLLCVNLMEIPRSLSLLIKFLYGPLPTCTYEDALDSFMTEEQKRITPTCTNYYMLIQMFMHFHNLLEARDYLVKLGELKVQSNEDLLAKEQSAKYMPRVAEEIKLDVQQQAMKFQPTVASKEDVYAMVQADKENVGILDRILNYMDEYKHEEQASPLNDDEYWLSWEDNPLAWRNIKNAAHDDAMKTDNSDKN